MHVDPIRRHRRPALCVLAVIVALGAALAGGGLAWLALVPAVVLLRPRAPVPQAVSGQAQYGVGAALAGFTPARRD